MRNRSLHLIGRVRERSGKTMNSIEEQYRAATEKSAQLAKRAERVMPGGDTRTTTYYRPYPLTLKRGEGPFVVGR